MSVAEILQWAEHEGVRLSVHGTALAVGDSRQEGHSAALSEAITANRLALIEYLQTPVPTETVLPLVDTPPPPNGHVKSAPARRVKAATAPPSDDPNKVSLTERHELENILHDVLMGSMNPSQFTVLLYIARHTLGFNVRSIAMPLKHFSEGHVTRKGERLTRGAGVSASSAKEALNYLEGRGLIRRARRDSDYGDKDSTIYTVVADAWRAEQEAMKRGDNVLPESPNEAKEVSQNLAEVSQNLAYVGQPLARGLARIWPTVGQPLAYPHIEEKKGTVNEGKRRRVRGTSRAPVRGPPRETMTTPTHPTRFFSRRTTR